MAGKIDTAAINADTAYNRIQTKIDNALREANTIASAIIVSTTNSAALAPPYSVSFVPSEISPFSSLTATKGYSYSDDLNSSFFDIGTFETGTVVVPEFEQDYTLAMDDVSVDILSDDFNVLPSLGSSSTGLFESISTPTIDAIIGSSAIDIGLVATLEPSLLSSEGIDSSSATSSLTSDISSPLVENVSVTNWKPEWWDDLEDDLPSLNLSEINDWLPNDIISQFEYDSDVLGLLESQVDSIMTTAYSNIDKIESAASDLVALNRGLNSLQRFEPKTGFNNDVRVISGVTDFAINRHSAIAADRSNENIAIDADTAQVAEKHALGLGVKIEEVRSKVMISFKGLYDQAVNAYTRQYSILAKAQSDTFMLDFQQMATDLNALKVEAQVNLGINSSEIDTAIAAKNAEVQAYVAAIKRVSAEANLKAQASKITSDYRSLAYTVANANLDKDITQTLGALEKETKFNEFTAQAKGIEGGYVGIAANISETNADAFITDRLTNLDATVVEYKAIAEREKLDADFVGIATRASLTNFKKDVAEMNGSSDLAIKQIRDKSAMDRLHSRREAIHTSANIANFTKKVEIFNNKGRVYNAFDDIDKARKRTTLKNASRKLKTDVANMKAQTASVIAAIKADGIKYEHDIQSVMETVTSYGRYVSAINSSLNKISNRLEEINTEG
jgi:hypothetical protein